jgi:hypothetical protein
MLRWQVLGPTWSSTISRLISRRSRVILSLWTKLPSPRYMMGLRSDFCDLAITHADIVLQHCSENMDISQILWKWLTGNALPPFFLSFFLSSFLSFLSFCFSIFLFFYFSVFLSFYLSIFLSFYRSIFFIFLYFYLSIFLFFYFSIFLSFYFSIFLSFYLSFCPSFLTFF